MKPYGIFYGSTTGTTERVAHDLADLLKIGDADVHDVANCAPSAVADYETIIIGSPTWGDGDVQDDMEDFLAGLKALTLKGHKIAIFGLGDETMSDTFCNAVGKIYRELKPTGAEFVGSFPDNVYNFHHTDADIDGRVVGLLLDDVNHPDLTPGRLQAWVETL